MLRGRSRGLLRLWPWRLLGIAGLVLCLRQPGEGLVLVVLECLWSSPSVWRVMKMFSQELFTKRERERERTRSWRDSMINNNLGSSK